MKKKALKLLALLAALILILGLGWTANSLVGNPISKYLATKGAKKYLSENFPGADYCFEGIHYNFKDGAYCAEIKSPSSIDTHFTLSMDMAGRCLQDSFDQVEDKSTTAFRLDREYRELTDQVLESPSFPYKSDLMYGTLEIHPGYEIGTAHNPDTTNPLKGLDKPDNPSHLEGFRQSDNLNDSNTQKSSGGLDIPAYSLIQEDLELDRLYDIRQLGAQAGRLVIYMESDTLTIEKAAEAILGIRQSMDDAGIPFHAMEFHLQEPLPEDGSPRTESIDVLNILYKDIQKEHFIDTVERADEEAKAYYAELDKELDSEKNGSIHGSGMR